MKTRNFQTRQPRQRRHAETSIKLVADKLNMPLAAVSRVFLGKRVEPERRRQVLEAARELDFVPRLAAPTILLAIGRTNPEVHAGYTTVLSQLVLQELARKTTYPISVVPEADENRSALEAALAQPSVRCVIAIVFSDALEHAVKAVRFPPPVVTLNHPVPKAINVQTDHHAHGFRATQYLIEHGHKRIAFLAHELATWGSSQRYDGYRDALQRHGIRPTAALRFLSAEADTSTDDPVKALLERLDEAKPTAVLSFAEDVALPLIRYFDVPQRISVVGLDDLPIWKHLRPAVTTIWQPLERMAQVAVEHAWRLARLPRAEAAGHAQDIILESELMRRESVVNLMPSGRR